MIRKKQRVYEVLLPKTTHYRRPKPIQNKKSEWCCSLKTTHNRRPKPIQNKKSNVVTP